MKLPGARRFPEGGSQSDWESDKTMYESQFGKVIFLLDQYGGWQQVHQPTASEASASFVVATPTRTVLRPTTLKACLDLPMEKGHKYGYYKIVEVA